MTMAPPNKALQSLLSGLSPGLSVEELQAVPSARLQVLYSVKVSEGSSLLLTLTPPTVMRLLRSEESAIGSEAAVLRWLSVLERPMKEAESCRSTMSSGKEPKVSYGPGTDKSLFEYLPVLVKHGSIDGNLAVEYNLSQPPRGTAVSVLSRPLNFRERRSFYFQVGQLLRQISTQVSSDGRFGLAADVLSVGPSTAQVRRLEGGLHTTRGAGTWSTAFHSLLESILRDGEDLSVMINYSAIRRHFDRFEHLLGQVRRPRLVVMDAGEDANTLVFRLPQPCRIGNGTSEGQRESRQERKLPQRTTSEKSSKQVSNGSDAGISEEKADGATNITDTPERAQIEVTGLRQWSNCIFGDPLIATIFSRHPTRDFWCGFDDSFSREGSDRQCNLIEDEANAHIRLLLYECYHAVVAIVKEFYRPGSDSSERELAARKRLTDVLARLDALEDSGTPRRRRPSGEMSPAKRPKKDDESESDS